MSIKSGGSDVKVVSVINYKGGVGKTTVTANLGAELAYRGYRVLLIDLDPQASLTFSFFRPPEWIHKLAKERTIRRWFDEFIAGQGDTELSDLIVTPPDVKTHLKHPDGRLDLIASHLGLINVDLHLAAQLVGMGPAQAKARFLEVHGRLADGLAADAFSRYDLILIDCPPNFNIVTKTAIVASSHLLVPSRADDLSTLGISYLIRNVDDLVKDYNDYVRMPPRIRPGTAEVRPAILGVVFTMVQIYGGKLTKTNQDFIARTKRELQVPAFNTTVRSNQRLYADATSSGVPLAVAANVHDDIARELDNLADEFLVKIGMEGSSR
jgi:chromosome partitioning protein